MNDWPVPSNLPPCWWVAVTRQDLSIDFYSAYDTKQEAEESYVLKQAGGWLEKPLRLDVVPEDPTFIGKRGAANLFFECQVTARWHWFHRNRDLLLTWHPPLPCEAVIPSKQSPSNDLRANRFGGAAVLPAKDPWPSYKINAEEAGWRTALDFVTGMVLTGKRKIYRPHATFAGTLDLRSMFSFGGDFPDAISIFLPTYDVPREKYTDAADVDLPEGIIVPLHPGQSLVEAATPDHVLQLVGFAGKVHRVPDFPSGLVDLGDFLTTSPSVEYLARKILFERIEELEPGTGSWIHVNATKVGGYESAIQSSLLKSSQAKHPRLEWHFIAAFSDDRIAMGDSGLLAIVAGHDRKKGTWMWRCAWECH